MNERHADRSRVLFLALIAAVFLTGAYIVLSYPANHDIAWLLYASGRVLDGVPLYDRIVEINPPLIIWLSAAAEWLARMLGSWDMTIYKLLVLGLAAGSIALCRQQLGDFAGGFGKDAKDIVAIVLAYLFVAHVGFEFGQREHLAIMLVLPFLFLAARQAGGAVPASHRDVLIGVLAAIGFALKPHFMLVLVFVAGFALVRRRAALRTPAWIALAVVLVLYALIVLLAARGYFALLALTARPYALYGNSSFVALLETGVFLRTLVALLLGTALLWATPYRDLAGVLCVAGLAFLIAVVAQSKGWAYHWIPSSTIAVVLLVLAVSHFVRPRAVMLIPAVAAAAALVLCVRNSGDIAAQRARMEGKAYQLPAMMQLVHRHAERGSIATLSTNLQSAFPLVNYTGVRWALRFNTLWLLPGLYPPAERTVPLHYHELDHMPGAERYMFDAVVEDLARNRPNVLVVDTRPPGYVLQGFDYLAYFGRDARFVGLMRAYHEIEPIERYRVFVRS